MEINRDISIGKGQSIKWIELDNNDGDLLRIDALLDPTIPFWKSLETQCCAECCGIEAFALWPEDIRRASLEVDAAELKKQLMRLKAEISKSHCNIVVSSQLNNLFDKRVFISLIDHIVSNL